MLLYFASARAVSARVDYRVDCRDDHVYYRDVYYRDDHVYYRDVYYRVAAVARTRADAIRIAERRAAEYCVACSDHVVLGETLVSALKDDTQHRRWHHHHG
jgi:hypothetical protein